MSLGQNGLAFQDHLPNIISIMQLSTDTLHSWSFRASHATNTAQHPSGIVAFYDTKIQTTYVLAQCSPRIYIALVAEGRCERDAVVLGFVGEVARALRNEEVLHVWRAASV